MSLLDAVLMVMDKLLSECFSNLSETEVVLTSSRCCLLFLPFDFFVSLLVAKQASDKSIFGSSSMPTISSKGSFGFTTTPLWVVFPLISELIRVVLNYLIIP